MEDKNIKQSRVLLANILKEYYVLPFTHEEITSLLKKVHNLNDAYTLTKNEYLMIKAMLQKDYFSGNYEDLNNKPFIPTRLYELDDYNSFRKGLNDELEAFNFKIKELDSITRTHGLYIDRVESSVNSKLEELKKQINEMELFEGSTLGEVLTNISVLLDTRVEKEWLYDNNEEPILDNEGNHRQKVLSDNNFSDIYNNILASITENGGLERFIDKVIAKSIVNEDGIFNSELSNESLFSIGKALNSKVDKEDGKGLSTNDYTNSHYSLIDSMINYEPGPASSATGKHGFSAYIYDQCMDCTNEEFGRVRDEISLLRKDTTQAIHDLDREIHELSYDTKVAIDNAKKELLQEIDNIPKHENIHILNKITQEVFDKWTNNVFSISKKVTMPVGGLQVGEELRNQSIQSILTKMLCPHVPPTVNAYLTCSPIGTNHEKGSTVAVLNIKVDIIAGSEKIKNIEYYVNGVHVWTNKSTTCTFQIPKEITDNLDSGYFRVKVIDESDNYVNAKVAPINFYYPFYYGAIDHDAHIGESNIKSLTKHIEGKNSKTYYYTTNHQKMVIAYPKAYGRLRSIVDQNGFEQISSFNVSEVSIKGLDNTVQEYFVYANNPSSNTNFKMTFNF